MVGQTKYNFFFFGGGGVAKTFWKGEKGEAKPGIALITLFGQMCLFNKKNMQMILNG